MKVRNMQHCCPLKCNSPPPASPPVTAPSLRPCAEGFRDIQTVLPANLQAEERGEKPNSEFYK